MDVLVTAGSVILGGAITAAITWLYGRTDTRRKHRLDYLVAAYHSLHRASHRTLDQHDARELEDAVDKVFLFGNPEQIRLAEQFVHEFAMTGGADLTPLLLSLRGQLRKELGLRGDGAGAVTTLRVSTNASGPSGQDRAVPLANKNE